MKKFFLLVLLAVLTGCSSISMDVQYQQDRRVTTAGETNLFRPSLSVMTVDVCLPEEGRHTVNVIDGIEHHCYGDYENLATVQGTQAGALTGLGGAMVQGGAIVGGAYLLGDGIRDSAAHSQTNVNQEGGGANVRSNASSSSRSRASTRQWQRQSQYQQRQW